jgi:hypothetical protein
MVGSSWMCPLDLVVMGCESVILFYLLDRVIDVQKAQVRAIDDVFQPSSDIYVSYHEHLL